jgi:hypothetical protein
MLKLSDGYFLGDRWGDYSNKIVSDKCSIVKLKNHHPTAMRMEKVSF